MEDPVVAGDHHSYDRKFIQAWFDKGNKTSPLTRDVISRRLAPNQSLKTQIKEWVDDQLRGKADMQKLDKLKVKIFSAATSEEAISLVTQISDLVHASKFCLLPTSGVKKMTQLFEEFLTGQLRASLGVLAERCRKLDLAHGGQAFLQRSPLDQHVHHRFVKVFDPVEGAEGDAVDDVGDREHL